MNCNDCCNPIERCVCGPTPRERAVFIPSGLEDIEDAKIALKNGITELERTSNYTLTNPGHNADALMSISTHVRHSLRDLKKALRILEEIT